MKPNLRRIIYKIRHDYINVNNIVIAVAFMIALSFIWGSLSAMQRNYTLQRNVDLKRQQLEVAKLQTENLQLQQQYYRTAEYQELALRSALGLALPGERQLILPPNSQAAKDVDKPNRESTITPQSTNLEQWFNFLFGGYSRSISGD